MKAPRGLAHRVVLKEGGDPSLPPSILWMQTCRRSASVVANIVE
jgi:hypothetical protein